MKVCFLSVIGLFFCINSYSQVIIDTIIILDDKNSIIVRNSHATSAKFHISINDNFYVGEADIVNEINKIKEEQEPDYIAAWRYVAQKTFHSEPLTFDNWQHIPTLFINSIGGGFCDDRASVLAAIWRILGYQSRVILLNGHVIPEVFVNNKWEMYDPDLYLYYEKDGVVLSVNELVENPDVIRKKPIGRRFAKYYESTEDNSDETSFFVKNERWTDMFFLPGFSELIIARTSPISVFVRLSHKSTGVLKTPFLPIYLKGAAKFMVNGQLITTSEGEEYFFKNDAPVKEINFHRTSDSLEIYYLVSPLMDVFEKHNEISLKSNKRLILEGGNIKLNQIYKRKRLFYKRYRLFLHKLKVNKTTKS